MTVKKLTAAMASLIHWEKAWNDQLETTILKFARPSDSEEKDVDWYREVKHFGYGDKDDPVEVDVVEDFIDWLDRGYRYGTDDTAFFSMQVIAETGGRWYTSEEAKAWEDNFGFTELESNPDYDYIPECPEDLMWKHALEFLGIKQGEDRAVRISALKKGVTYALYRANAYPAAWYFYQLAEEFLASRKKPNV
jgi:hypothetical protein